MLRSAEPRGQRVALDVVIPIYNEAAVLPALLHALAETFTPEARERDGLSRVSCLFVDDGSMDDSVRVLRESPTPFDVTIVRLSRNFGHQPAITAGLAYSTADLVAVMDADLQDPPACIAEMIAEWRRGHDVVYAVRQNRSEGRVKVLLYWAFYRLYRLLTPIEVPVDSGDFCLMSRRVVDELNRLPEKLRFPRGLRSWVGFSQTAIRYDRPARRAGRSRYGWRELYHLATDGIASASVRPLQVAQILSIVYLFLSLIGVAALGLGAFDRPDVELKPSAVLVAVLLSNGLVLFCLYILGAYLGRTYLEVKGRPTYIVAEVIHGPATRTP